MRQEHITSRQNPLLVHIRKLQASRSYRKASGEFAAEGTKLLEEAAKWYPGLHTVVCREGLRLCKLPEQVRVVTVPEDVFKSISTVDTPQGAIFLCRLPERQQADLTAGILHDVKSTHASDDDWVCDKQVATARANAYVDFALAVAKKLGLFASETDSQETIRFWKYYQRVQ